MEKREPALTEQFITLSRMMMHRHHHMKGHHIHNPYHGQGRILSLLKLEPEMSQKKLSFLLGTRPQSIGELLAKLEQNGFITRKQSNEDKRSLNIRLTEKGMEAATSDETIHDFGHKTDEVFNCLTPEEQKKFGIYLEKVISSLKETQQDGECDFAEHPMHHHGYPMKYCGHRPEKS